MEKFNKKFLSKNSGELIMLIFARRSSLLAENFLVKSFYQKETFGKFPVVWVPTNGKDAQKVAQEAENFEQTPSKQQQECQRRDLSLDLDISPWLCSRAIKTANFVCYKVANEGSRRAWHQSQASQSQAGVKRAKWTQTKRTQSKRRASTFQRFLATEKFAQIERLQVTKSCARRMQHWQPLYSWQEWKPN